MSKQVMVIYDKDLSYGSRLCEYLSTREQFPFALWHFGEAAAFTSFCRVNQVEIALISEGVELEEEIEHGIGRVFHLTLNRENEKNQGDQIYKFQSAELILKKIMQVYSGRETMDKKGKTKLIGIYTPVGRCLQTSFTLVLGQILARRSKVLYINFEGCSGFTHITKREYTLNLSDLIYYVTKNTDKFLNYMHEMVETVNGLDYIPPVRTFMDVTMVEADMWNRLLEEFLSISEYDYILLDLSDQLRGLFDILRKCSRIYTIQKEDGFAKAKILQYEEMLQIANYNDILKKTKRYQIPIFRNIPMLIDKLPYSELGSYVKKIVEEDFSEEFG